MCGWVGGRSGRSILSVQTDRLGGWFERWEEVTEIFGTDLGTVEFLLLSLQRVTRFT